MKKEDINIYFQEGRPIIRGERRLENKKQSSRYHMLETQYGSFTRNFYLPDNVNPDMIKAQMNDGVLHVTVPKDDHNTRKG